MATTAKQPAPEQIKIDADVIGFLKTGGWSTTTEGDPALAMPMTKDRKLYEKTAKVLKALGGKWSRKYTATIFTEDVDAETAVREACESGIYVDSKQLFQFFETPTSVSDLMLDELCFKPGVKYTVLEPSAGHGALICAVASLCVTDGPDIELTAVELDSKKEGRLKEMVGSASQVTKRLVIGDFMSMNPEGVERLGLFDRIIMNPPFTRGQDMAHVRHAFKFLKQGGILVAILSPAFVYRSDNSSKLFRDWLELRQSADCASWVPLPEGSFKSSGTNVRTVMLTMRKREVSESQGAKLRVMTVHAADVVVGDYLFNNLATHPAFQWCRVVRVEPTTTSRSFDPKDGSYASVEISTSGWSTYKHKLEGVTVRRC